ncbi:unnamed protein product, partial [Symbiodinium sp. CCMP2456]
MAESSPVSPKVRRTGVAILGSGRASTPAIATISVSIALVLQAYNHGIDANVFP